MKKFLAILLAVLMICGTMPAFAENVVNIVSASVSNGDNFVSISPKFFYEFDGDISAYTPEISLSDSTGTAAVISDSLTTVSGKTLTFRVANELKYFENYTLSIKLKSNGEEVFADTIAFKTKYGDDVPEDPKNQLVWMVEDNFETGVFNTKKWRPVNTSVEKPDGEDNFAIKLIGATGVASQFLHYYNGATVQLDIPKKAVASFRLRMDSLAQTLTTLQIVGVDNSTTGNMLRFRDTNTLSIMDGTTETYLDIEDYFGDWLDFRFIFDIETLTYRLYLNDALVKRADGSADFTLPTTTTTEALKKGGVIRRVVFITNARGTNATCDTVYYVDDMTVKPATFVAPDNTAFGIVSSNTNGRVGTNDELSYTFSHDINPATIKHISLNDDESFIKSATISGRTLNIKLAKELAYNTEYKLSFGYMEDIYGSLAEDVTFKTRYGTNIVEDSFENGFDASASNTNTKWRINENGAEEWVDDIVTGKAQGKVVHLVGTSAAAARLDNAYRVKGGKDMPGNAVVEFKCLIPESMSSAWYRPYLSVFGTKEDGIVAENTGMLIIVPQNEGANFNIYFGDKEGGKSFGTYTCTKATDSNYNFNEWIKITYVIDTANSTYRAFINDTDTGKTYSLKAPFATDTLNQIRFTCGNGYEIYLDDIKIAQAVRGEESGFYNAKGEKTDVCDPDDTVYKSVLVNNTPADEKVTLFIAVLDSESERLESVDVEELTIPKNGVLEFEKHFKNLGGKAYNRTIKAFYVKSLDSMQPFEKNKNIDSDAILPGTPPESINVTLSAGEEIKAVYPGGLYKAVTLRFDDGKDYDRDMLEIMNENGLKGTFYLISSTTEASGKIHKDEIATVYAGHEVASHSYDHNPDNVTTENLTEAREFLSDAWGSEVIGFGYPSNTYGTVGKTAYINMLKASGHVYANMGAIPKPENIEDEKTVTDIPDFSKPYEIVTSNRVVYETFLDSARAYAENTEKKQSLYFSCGHSTDFVTDGVFDGSVMESFAEIISGRDDIWYATNGDILTYLLAQYNLNIKGAGVYVNESRKTVYYLIGEELIELTPGSVLTITEG